MLIFPNQIKRIAENNFSACSRNTKSFYYGLYMFFSKNYVRIKLDSYDYLLLEKALTFHKVVIHFKPVLRKDQNHYI